MLSAISNIVVAPPDLTPVLREIDKLNVQTRDFATPAVDLSPITRAITRLNSQDTHQELLNAIRNIEVEPPDLTPIVHEIRKLNSQERHVEMLSAISNIVVAPPDLTPVLREIDKLNVQTRDFATPAVDLSPITRAITRLNSQDTHQELLNAIRNIKVEPPDVGLFDERFQTFTREVRQEVSTFASGLQQDVASMRRDFEQWKVAQASESLRVGRSVEGVTREEQVAQHAEILAAIRKMKTEPDTQRIANEVCEMLVETRLPVDNAEVLEAIRQNRPDVQAIAHAVHQKVKTLDFGTAQLLEEVRGLSAEHDHERVAACVWERLVETPLRVDHTEVLDVLAEVRCPVLDLSPVLQAIDAAEIDFTPLLEAIHEGRNARSVDLDAMAAAVHNRVRNHDFGHSEVLEAVETNTKALSRLIGNIDLSTVHDSLERIEVASNVRCPPVDLSPVLRALDAAEIDLSPVLEAIHDGGSGRGNVDVDAIAAAVHQRIRNHDFGHGDVLEVVKTNATALSHAIATIDLSPLRQALGRLEARGDDEVLRAIRQVSVEIDYDAVADAVHKRIRNCDFGHLEVLSAVRNLRHRDTDLTPVLAALNAAEIDFAPVYEAIESATKSETPELLHAISDVKFSLEQLRSDLAKDIRLELDAPPAMQSVPHAAPSQPLAMQVVRRPSLQTCVSVPVIRSPTPRAARIQVVERCATPPRVRSLSPAPMATVVVRPSSVFSHNVVETRGTVEPLSASTGLCGSVSPFSGLAAASVSAAQLHSSRQARQERQDEAFCRRKLPSDDIDGETETPRMRRKGIEARSHPSRWT